MVSDLIQKATLTYKAHNYSDALEIYEEIQKKDIEAFEQNCKFNYMWCIFRVKLKDDSAFLNDQAVKTYKYINYILDHLTNKDFLFQITVFRVLRFLKKKQNFEAEKFIYWLDKLDPEYLSDQPTVTERDGKPESYPSNKEEWYALKSKALKKLECYSECLHISEEALSKFDNFHYNNDVWIKRRIAECKNKLGHKEEALEIFSDLLRYKQEWFIFKDISSIYFEQGQLNEALSNGINAMMKSGDDDKKVNLLWFIGEILNSMSKREDAQLFMDYSVKIRQDSGWKLDNEISDYYNLRRSQIDGITQRELKFQIDRICEMMKWQDKQLMTGTVMRVLPDGRSGFINTDSDSFYFRVDEFKGKRSEIVDGLRVEFYSEKSFDKKKNRESLCAVNIRSLK